MSTFYTTPAPFAAAALLDRSSPKTASIPRNPGSPHDAFLFRNNRLAALPPASRRHAAACGSLSASPGLEIDMPLYPGHPLPALGGRPTEGSRHGR